MEPTPSASSTTLAKREKSRVQFAEPEEGPGDIGSKPSLSKRDASFTSSTSGKSTTIKPRIRADEALGGCQSPCVTFSLSDDPLVPFLQTSHLFLNDIQDVGSFGGRSLCEGERKLVGSTQADSHNTTQLYHSLSSQQSSILAPYSQQEAAHHPPRDSLSIQMGPHHAPSRVLRLLHDSI